MQAKTFYYELSPRETLQARLLVLVDPDRHNLYCGKLQTQATDSLYGGCLDFSGYTEVSNSIVVYSAFSVYHCTHITYNFAGGVESAPCPHGAHLNAVNYVTEFPDSVQTGNWYC
jgi:hypothetical protein